MAKVAKPKPKTKAISDADDDMLKTGRWTEDEHRIFLEGLGKHGKDWKTISKMLKTRTSIQIRTHAQKYFIKFPEAEKRLSVGDARKGKQIPESPKRTYGGFEKRSCKNKTQRLKKTQSSPNVLKSNPARLKLENDPLSIGAISESVPEVFPVGQFYEGRTSDTYNYNRGRSASMYVKQTPKYSECNPELIKNSLSCHATPIFEDAPLREEHNNMIIDFGGCMPAHVREDLNRFKLDEELDLLAL